MNIVPLCNFAKQINVVVAFFFPNPVGIKVVFLKDIATREQSRMTNEWWWYNEPLFWHWTPSKVP